MPDWQWYKGERTEECHVFKWFQLFQILPPKNHSLPYCFFISHRDFRLLLACVWQRSSLLLCSWEILVWMLWSPSSILHGKVVSRSSWDKVKHLLQIVMAIVEVLLALYFLLNMYNLAWVLLPGFSKLRSIMNVYKVKLLEVFIFTPDMQNLSEDIKESWRTRAVLLQQSRCTTSSQLVRLQQRSFRPNEISSSHR